MKVYNTDGWADAAWVNYVAVPADGKGVGAHIPEANLLLSSQEQDTAGLLSAEQETRWSGWTIQCQPVRA